MEVHFIILNSCDVTDVFLCINNYALVMERERFENVLIPQ